jgi:multiple sugar transport system substrate-binding protein/raffinose/stachyose/melibiose transport system substrate-binding protein
MKKVIVASMIVSMVLGMFGAMALAEELVINSLRSDPVPKEALAAIVAKFQELHPEIEVKLNTTDMEGFKKSVRLWLASDNPPDVITWFAGNRAVFFIEKGLIMDITDVWEGAGLFEKFPKAFQSISFSDGKAYFLPDTYYWWAVYYRKSIFEKYNLSEPKTWEEFLQVCATLKENDVTPISIGTKFRWTAAGWFDYLNMRVNGPEFHMDLMLGKVPYNDPRVLKVFEPWKQLLDNGYFLENAASYTWQEAVGFMARGEAAMYLMGQFILGTIPEEIQDDVDFFQFPVIDPDVPLGEDAPTDGYMIPAKAQNPEAAKLFLQFVASPEAQQIQVEMAGRIVPSSEVPMDLYPPETQKGIQMMQGVDALAQFYDRDSNPEMADRGMDGFMEFWYRPDSIGQILDRLEKDRQRIYQEAAEAE